MVKDALLGALFCKKIVEADFDFICVKYFDFDFS